MPLLSGLWAFSFKNNNTSLCQRFIIFGKVFLITIMKNKILLPIFYLPPISWFSIFLDGDNHIFLEQFENFPKQTYRNRTAIYGSQRKTAAHHSNQTQRKAGNERYRNFLFGRLAKTALENLSKQLIRAHHISSFTKTD